MLLRLQGFNIYVTYKKGTQMYVADTLSRAPQHGQSDACETNFFEELEDIKHAEDVNMKDTTLDRIRSSYEDDAIARLLKTTIIQGWPESRSQLPNSIKVFFAHRDELTVDNGVVYKGSRVVIPPALQPEMISKTHYSHIGIAACLRRARDVLFWPGMANQMREFILRCARCKEERPALPKELLQNHQMPDTPWARVGMDLFTFENQDYLILIDYYSDFWEIDMLGAISSAAVIKACKRQFSRHGILTTVVTDNGLQFARDEFRSFAKDWGLTYR